MVLHFLTEMCSLEKMLHREAEQSLGLGLSSRTGSRFWVAKVGLASGSVFKFKKISAKPSNFYLFIFLILNTPFLPSKPSNVVKNERNDCSSQFVCVPVTTITILMFIMNTVDNYSENV